MIGDPLAAKAAPIAPQEIGGDPAFIQKDWVERQGVVAHCARAAATSRSCSDARTVFFTVKPSCCSARLADVPRACRSAMRSGCSRIKAASVCSWERAPDANAAGAGRLFERRTQEALTRYLLGPRPPHARVAIGSTRSRRSIGRALIPVVIFVVLGLTIGGSLENASPENTFVAVEVPVFAALLMILSAVVSIVAIISIYREGGILKRLRATPLRPQTILTAHVVVKLLFTLLTLALMLLAGRRFYPINVDVPFASFALALLFSTWSILSVGFLIASLVPTARFAQPLASIIL